MLCSSFKSMRALKKYKIGLLVQAVSNFENFFSFYNAAKNDPSLELVFIALGSHDVRLDTKLDPSKLAQDTQRLLLSEYGIDSLLAHDGNGYIDMASLNLDSMFIQSPYDSLRPTKFMVEALSSITKICYIPYASFIIPLDDYYYGLNFYDFSWKIFLENHLAKNMAQSYLGSTKWNLRKRKVIITGSPKLDKYLNITETLKENPTIIWAPHCAIQWANGKEGYSNFIKYKDLLIELLRQHPNINFILRCHPLTKIHLIKEGGMTHQEVELYFHTFKSFPNGTIDDPEQSHWETFSQSTAMITDGVSFLTEYPYSGKPLLYTEKTHNAPGLNMYGDQLKIFLYIAHEEDQVREFVEKVANNDDPRKQERIQGIKKLLVLHKGGNAHFIKTKLKRALLLSRIKSVLFGIFKRYLSLCKKVLTQYYRYNIFVKRKSLKEIPSLQPDWQSYGDFVKYNLLPKIGWADNLLDIGLATPIILPWCCCKVVGYSSAKDQVLAAREYAATSHWDRAHFFQKGLTDLLSIEGQYNHILAIDVLNKIMLDIEYSNTLKSMYKLLKPGGYVVLSDVLTDESPLIYTGKKKFAKIRNLNKYLELLLKLGFRIVVHETVNYYPGQPYKMHLLLLQKGFYNAS